MGRRKGLAITRIRLIPNTTPQRLATSKGIAKNPSWPYHDNMTAANNSDKAEAENRNRVMLGILPQKALGKQPLYTGLLSVIAGGAIATLLALAGSFAVQDQFSHLLAELTASCAAAPTSPPCSLIDRLDRELLERTSAMLLLQILCAVLILVGLSAIAFQGHRLLIRRLASALQPASRLAAQEPVDGDEFDRMAGAIAMLAARQSGLEAEVAWQKKMGEEQVRRRTFTLHSVQEIIDIFSCSEASEWALLEAMGLVERTLSARSVAIVLEAASRQVLGSSETLCTRQTPRLSSIPLESMGGGEMFARLLPQGSNDSGQALVVSMQCRARPVGTLLIELYPGAQADETHLRLAELFARIAAIAIAGLSDSVEERRGALLEERSAIAAELHDSLAQSLAFMKIQVARLQKSVGEHSPDGESARIAAELRTGISAAYGEVRELIAAFRTRISDAGLIASLEEAIHAVEARYGIAIQLEHELGRCRLDVNEQFHILQLVRESLSNVVRHSGARWARVSLSYGPGHQIEVVVEDDGRGMEAPLESTDHYGLSIMQERSALLGGQLTVGQRGGGGTRLQLLFSPKRLPAEASFETAA